MRVLAAALSGVAIAAGAAVVVGDYPLTGMVPWLAAVIVPLIIGGATTMVAGRHGPWFWLATGPVAAGSLFWGERIATGWGLDPVPGSGWAAVGIAATWPPAWALLSSRRPGRPEPVTDHGPVPAGSEPET